jgi:TonB family protein
VRPRRRRALLCGPPTSPLDVMRGALCLITVLLGLASQASAGVPECRPKRAVVSIASLDLGSLPRTPPLGYVDVAFTIAPTGEPRDIVVLSSHIDWPEANARALKLVANARFDPPSSFCRQAMRVRFDAK